jgi:hypothetical protein
MKSGKGPVSNYPSFILLAVQTQIILFLSLQPVVPEHRYNEPAPLLPAQITNVEKFFTQHQDG